MCVYTVYTYIMFGYFGPFRYLSWPRLQDPKQGVQVLHVGLMARSSFRAAAAELRALSANKKGLPENYTQGAQYGSTKESTSNWGGMLI